MRKTWFLLVGSLLLLVLIGGCILLVQRASTAQANASVSRQSATCVPANTTYSRSRGIPAITPHLHINAANSAAFTESDVRQYVSCQRNFGEISPLPGTKVVVAKVEFLTSQAVAKLIHESPGDFPASHLLCYVELQGNFSIPTGPGGGTSAAVHTIQEVFDAQTGNLLEEGT